jgi:hypothetical protein
MAFVFDEIDGIVDAPTAPRPEEMPAAPPALALDPLALRRELSRLERRAERLRAD